jgi:hypothetical protein
MFFSKKKGLFPYLKKAPIYQGLITLVLMILPAGLFLIGFNRFGGAKNLFTVAAVVGMLPAAKSIVSFIMFLRAEKFSCPESLHHEIAPLEGKGALIGYDYFLTSYSANFPLPVAAVGKGVLIAYMTHPKFKAADCEAHIKEYLKKNDIKDINVKVFDQEAKFVERIKVLSESEEELTSNEAQAFALLSSLSL